MGTHNYNLKDVSITLNGIPMSGFGDGDALTLERRSDSFELTVGADGEGAYSKSNDRSGTGVLRIMYGKSSNLALEAQRQLDEIGAFLFTLVVRDTNGTTKATAKDCRITKPPPFTVGKTNGVFEWPFLIADLEIAPGVSFPALSL